MEVVIEPNWDFKEKRALPEPNSDIWIRCIDGKERKGRYEPDCPITPWIFDNDQVEDLGSQIRITGWSYRK